MLKGDLRVLDPIMKQLRDGVKLCETEQDYISRALLVDLLATAEDVVDWIETQQWQIDNAGIENYTAAQMESD